MVSFINSMSNYCSYENTKAMALPLALTPVQEFYKDQSVFVTGGTGFMGKVCINSL